MRRFIFAALIGAWLMIFRVESLATLQFQPKSLQIQLDTKSNISIILSEPLNSTARLVFNYDIGNDQIVYDDRSDIIEPVPELDVPTNITSVEVEIEGGNPGHVNLGINSTSPEIDKEEDVFVTISVVRSLALVVVNAVIGWAYFVAWSVSFYPQVYLNWKRKSVVGLNFDFLALNITGFLAYGFFNVGMYWVPTVMDQYHALHPRGVNPVQLNDVFFTIHAVVITAITIVQCFIYERGGQRISRVGLAIVILLWVFAIVTLVITLFHVITWLTYLYYFSYIKLGVTLIKYMPQAYMNFRRKSTEGWSIGNVLLDFTGGLLSLVQMFLISYNNDDWGSIFGDPTKFGLGVFSCLFDVLFMVQHYILYRGNSPYQLVENGGVRA